jgi:hypothetical protein
LPRKKEKFDPADMVHRLVTFKHHGLWLHGRIVAAGWETPFVIASGNITPVPFVVIAPEGTPSYTSTAPSDTVKIGVGSETWKKGFKWRYDRTGKTDKIERYREYEPG